MLSIQNNIFVDNFYFRSLLCCHSRLFMELFLNDEVILNDVTKKQKHQQLYYQLDGLDYVAVQEIIKCLIIMPDLCII